MALISNVALTNTFDTWRTRTNQVLTRMNQFAINESSLYANTLTANTSFTSKGLLTAQGRVAVGTNLTVSGNTTLGATGKSQLSSGVWSHIGNMSMTNVTVSGNTILGDANKTITTTGLWNHTGNILISANATISGTVLGIGSILGLVNMTGRAAVGTNLTVSGNTTLGAAGKTQTSTGAWSHTGTKSVSTNFTVTGNTSLGGSGKTQSSTGIWTHTGNKTVTGNTTLGGAGKTQTSTGIWTHTGNKIISANTTVSGRMGVGGAPFSNIKFAIIDTSAIKIPSGNTSQRPTGGVGYLRYNVTLSSFEGYNPTSSTWGSIGGGGGATGNTTTGTTNAIFWENETTITAPYAITSGKNAGTFGPVTINSGVTVTIYSGSTWSIV